MADKNTTGHEKMSDKEFYLKLALSLISIVGCVGMMISSALALFVSEAKSTENVIKAGDFDVVVTASCGCLENASASFIASCGAEDHTFTIEPSGTVDGFVKFIIEGNGNSVVRYTEQLSSPITVTIGAVNGTVIRFQPFWGRVENVNYSRLPLVSDYEYIFHSEKEETAEGGGSETGESNVSDSVSEEGADSSEDTQPPTDDNSDTGSEDIVDNSSDTDSNVEDSGLSDNSNDIADDSSESEEILDDVPVDDSSESEELSDDAPADDESVAE